MPTLEPLLIQPFSHMQLRVARHTNDLKIIIAFYTELVGLQNLGSFSDHDGYNGVFLGYENKDWHLEFTESSEPPSHSSDEDDLLVFYTDSDEEFNKSIARFEEKGLKAIPAKNPYWNLHGKQFLDPDGFAIIITKKRS